MTHEQEEPDSAFEATQYFFEDITPETSVGEVSFFSLGFRFVLFLREELCYIMMITWRGSHDICTSETSVVVMLSHVILTSCDLQMIVWLYFLWHHRLWVHVVHTDRYEGTATQMKVYTCVSAGGASIKLPQLQSIRSKVVGRRKKLLYKCM